MRWILLLGVVLAACSQGPEADLPSISQARSLGAEWALVNEQASAGKLTATYVTTMRKSIREQLKTCATSLTEPKSAYGEQIEALLAAPDAAPPALLRDHFDLADLSILDREGQRPRQFSSRRMRQPNQSIHQHQRRLTES